MQGQEGSKDYESNSTSPMGPFSQPEAFHITKQAEMNDHSERELENLCLKSLLF